MKCIFISIKVQRRTFGFKIYIYLYSVVFHAAVAYGNSQMNVFDYATPYLKDYLSIRLGLESLAAEPVATPYPADQTRTKEGRL